MNHPEIILRTLDRHLTQPTRMILYGRAALALGFPVPEPAFAATFDVDAILPRVEMDAIEMDDQFWIALESTNRELEPGGLYITHLFRDDQVVLSPSWLEHVVPIPLTGLRHLSILRPSVGDLVLTKMMRVDPQDRADILFLLSQIPSASSSIPATLDAAIIPVIPEIQAAFDENKRWILSLLAK
jgi:hypothetical protein